MPFLNIIAANAEAVAQAESKYGISEKVAKINEKIAPLLKKFGTGNSETDGYIALFVVIIGGFLLLMLLMRGRGSGHYDGRAAAAFEELDIRLRELRSVVDGIANEKRGQFEYIKQDLALLHQKLEEQSEQIRILAQPVNELRGGMSPHFRGARQ